MIPEIAHAVTGNLPGLLVNPLLDLTDRASADSNEINDGVVLDFDSNGALVGIDLQHASQRVDIDSLSVSTATARFIVEQARSPINTGASSYLKCSTHRTAQLFECQDSAQRSHHLYFCRDRAHDFLNAMPCGVGLAL